MQQGTFRLLHSGDVEDAFQLLVHLTNPISKGCWQCIRECGHRSHILVGPGKVGELPLHPLPRLGLTSLQCQFTLKQVTGLALAAARSLVSSSWSYAVLRSMLSCRACHQSSG
jgi:hypothetical protein